MVAIHEEYRVFLEEGVLEGDSVVTKFPRFVLSMSLIPNCRSVA